MGVGRTASCMPSAMSFSAQYTLFRDPLACREMLSIPEVDWVQAEMFLSMGDLLVPAGFDPTQIFLLLLITIIKHLFGNPK